MGRHPGWSRWSDAITPTPSANPSANPDDRVEIGVCCPGDFSPSLWPARCPESGRPSFSSPLALALPSQPAPTRGPDPISTQSHPLTQTIDNHLTMAGRAAVSLFDLVDSIDVDGRAGPDGTTAVDGSSTPGTAGASTPGAAAAGPSSQPKPRARTPKAKSAKTSRRVVQTGGRVFPVYSVDADTTCRCRYRCCSCHSGGWRSKCDSAGCQRCRAGA